MSKDEGAEIPDYLSVADMRQWLHQEIKDSAKAMELRLKEATDLVTAYSAGELTAEQADELHSRYYHRWGEALPGAMVNKGTTDEEILSRIDSLNGPFVPPRNISAQYRRLFGGTQDSARPKGGGGRDR